MGLNTRRMPTTVLALVVAAVVPCAKTTAQPGDAAIKSFEIARTTAPPVIDGVLGEGEWTDADRHALAGDARYLEHLLAERDGLTITSAGR